MAQTDYNALMFELDAGNVIDYLRRTGRLEADRPATAEWLSWGVSNVVLRVRCEGSDDIVVKQSREQLRTEAPWFSRLDRIWREAELMRSLRPLLPEHFVPRIVFEDRQNYVFAMQAVPDGHVVWKAELLAGRLDKSIAERLGEALARLHVGTLDNHELREQFGDREVFVQLRIDPFYRTIVRVHPELRGPIERMIEETLATSCCVVHADFSPKNVLVWQGSGTSDFNSATAGVPRRLADSLSAGRSSSDEVTKSKFEVPDPDSARTLTLVDYETGHYGDPAFDLGFFLSHLLLKAVRDELRRGEFIELARSFWIRYREQIATSSSIDADALERRSLLHLAGCMLARIDGTSPVEYLPDESKRSFVRSYCRGLLLDRPATLPDAFRQLEASSGR